MASHFTLPALLYDYEALAPYIDEETMRVHHQGHHATYVKNVNKLSIDGFNNASLHKLLMGLFENDGLSKADRATLLKSGGGHFNHSLFWQYMCPSGKNGQRCKLLDALIENDFGTFENFRRQFNEASVGLFGSGWCWWVLDTETRKSSIVTTENQENPVMSNRNAVCLLGLDVWEHAYYLKHQNKRAEYVEDWWNLVNWAMVSQIYEHVALQKKPLRLNEDGYILIEQ